MDLHLRQQFDVLLGTAGESFVERIVQRCAGQANALAALTRDRNAEGVWLDDFVDALFADQCLDNAEGAAWVLTALKARPMTAARDDRRGRDRRAGARRPGQGRVRRPAARQGRRDDEPCERLRMRGPQ